MHDIDFEKTFAPILRFENLRMLLTFTTHFDFHVKQMDVSNAYLKKDLKETIFMKISEDYEILKNQQKHDQVLHLLRFLYDLKQSGRK